MSDLLKKLDRQKERFLRLNNDDVRNDCGMSEISQKCPKKCPKKIWSRK